MYLSLKQEMERETQALNAKFDELQERVVEAEAKRDEVMYRRQWIRLGLGLGLGKGCNILLCIRF